MKQGSNNNLWEQGTVIIAREICTKKDYTEEEKNRIIELSRDDRSVWNEYLVSDFAEAWLDINNIIRYKGDKEEVRVLIDCGLNVGV